ncbi:MurR/RpiR family transcriptional regulator [Allomesorhizobium alhagi]|jgi:DNA-binding MurR/RpiR family transcriptional regulator|uniref:RpiR family transcriptional regulator n=1 Tax=Mesorhizobium alhagi CCNWXJ12-2 TaxID=1107882 RepID=H0HJA3_9HYPH|nr:MurR/RpiR family transcriptional regulator [Mesorhizobium alhagi]EHK59189.1 RpiR family transcriptional regulator [Mesorhizobium alhagi CCNWXJ12-2]
MDGREAGFDEVQGRILADLPELSSELRKAARFLVDHPDEVALVSMRVLASRSEVTPTTFVRLARRLGFADWAALRKPFEDRLRSGNAPFAAKADALVKRGAEAIFAESLRTISANLTAAEAVNGGDEIAKACAILERAQRIRVAGFRSCRAPAHAFVYLCRMFRRDITLLGGDSGALEAELAALGKREAIVAIGFSPYSRELGPVVEAARRHGVPIVAIADSMAAPVARHAEVTLRFSTDSPSFFPSVAAAMAIVEALAATMLARSGPAAAERVRETELELQAFGAYLAE